MNKAKVVFPSTVVNLGDIEQASTNNVAIFKFEGDSNSIEDIVASCSCTAEIYLNEDHIKAVYRDNTQVNASVIANLKEQGGRKYTDINKAITVFLRDGKPLKVPNQKGVMIYNQEKEKITLFIRAKVFIK